MRIAIVIGQMGFLLKKALSTGKFEIFAIGVVLCCIYHAITEKKDN